MKLKHVKIQAADGKDWGIKSPAETARRLTSDKPVDARFDLTVPENAAYTRPYFTRPDIEQSYYDISDHALSQLAPPSVSVGGLGGVSIQRRAGSTLDKLCNPANESPDLARFWNRWWLVPRCR